MLFHYLKFSLFHLLSVITIVFVLLGNDWIWLGYLCMTALIILGDASLGDDLSIPKYQYHTLLTLQLWLALPLLCLLMWVSLWSVSEHDVLGFGVWLSSIVPFDFLAARKNTPLWIHGLAIFYIGLMVSMIGTVPGHELVHRTWDKTSLVIGRWLLAFSFDSNFSIEHVYGHHKYVATLADPATAPRGRSVYTHIVVSTIKGNISAWNIEKLRLKRRRKPVLSHHNVFLRGVLMSVFLLLMAYVISGWKGVLFFTLVGLWAKTLLEIVNYMEHYGLVRDPNTAAAPHHSWNSNKKISSWTMFNLCRHSHHHAQGHLPFHKLQPYPEAPTMLFGYLATIAIALIPPLWFRLMQTKLDNWDTHFATEQERKLIIVFEKPKH
jgi:hypothetical protein